jgi:hypothetical protein
MAEEILPSAGNTPAVAPATPPALAATPDTPAVDGAETPIALEEAKKLRKEAATLRQQLKAFQDAEEQKKLAALSDVEKATKRADDLQQKYEAAQKQIVTSHIQLVAQKTGVRNPELVAGAIGHLLEYDKDTGMPTNLEKVLEDLKKSDAYLFVTAEPATPNQPRTPQFTANNPGRQNIYRLVNSFLLVNVRTCLTRTSGRNSQDILSSWHPVRSMAW